MELPPIDVIVPTHGRLDLTVKCLTALYENTETDFHLIVVDDSTDETPAYINALAKSKGNVTFIHHDEPYKCGNQFFNEALDACKHDYAAVVMNSVVVEPEWEIVALNLMEKDPEIGIVGFKSLDPSGLIESAGVYLDGYRCCDIGRGKPSHRFTKVNEPYSLQWAFALLRKEAAVGNLAEDIYHGFLGYDDLDNTLVLKSKGWKAVYCGMGVGYHDAHATRGTTDLAKLDNNLANAEIFYKRWGLWELYQEANPAEIVKKELAEMKGMLKDLLKVNE